MSSTVKREKEIGESAGGIVVFGKVVELLGVEDLKQAMLRHPGRKPVELDAVVVAQVNEGQ
jgi:hypothetical protein